MMMRMRGQTLGDTVGAQGRRDTSGHQTNLPTYLPIRSWRQRKGGRGQRPQQLEPWLLVLVLAVDWDQVAVVDVVVVGVSFRYERVYTYIHTYIHKYIQQAWIRPSLFYGCTCTQHTYLPTYIHTSLHSLTHSLCPISSCTSLATSLALICPPTYRLTDTPTYLHPSLLSLTCPISSCTSLATSPRNLLARCNNPPSSRSGDKVKYCR